MRDGILWICSAALGEAEVILAVGTALLFAPGADDNKGSS
jgi:hypothetical protein